MRSDFFRRRWSAWWENKRPVLGFGLRFGSLMALFYVLVLLPPCASVFYVVLESNARLSGGILNLLGQDCFVSGTAIRSAHFAINVRRGCDAIEPSWFFCAAVLAFPAPPVRKLAGVICGSTALQLLNLLRIVTLYLIGGRLPQYFNSAHVEIWPAAFVMSAVFLWIQWIRWTQQHDRRTP